MGKRRWLRLLAILLVVAGVLALTAHLSLPHVVTYLLRSSLEELAEDAERTIEFERLELVKLNEYNLYGVHVSDQGGHQSEPFFEADRIGLRLDRPSLFAGSVVVRAIELENPTLFLRDYADGSSNYGKVLDSIIEALGLSREAPETAVDGTGQGAPAQRREASILDELLASGLPQVSIVGGEIDFPAAVDDSVPDRVTNLTIDVRPTNSGYACAFDLSADVQGLGNGPFVRAPQHVELSGAVTPEDDVGEVMLGFGGPLELESVPGLDEVQLRFNAVGYEHPNVFRFDEVELLDRRSRTVVLHLPELRVTVRDMTLDIADLHLSMVEADGVRAYVEIDRQGRSNIARLLGLEGAGPLAHILPEHQRRRLEEGNDAQPIPAPEQAEPEVPEAEADPPRETMGWCVDKDWWECFPQTLAVTNVTMEVLVHDEGQVLRTVDIAVPSIRAGKRLLNFQMDVTAEMTMTERGVGPVGTASLDLIYYWMSERWRVELGFDDVNLGQFYEVSPYPNLLNLRTGILNGSLVLADDRPAGGDFRIGTDLTMTDLSVLAPSLDAAPVATDTLRYAFTGALNRDDFFAMSGSRFQLDALNADVRLELADLDLPVALDYFLGFTAGTRDDAYWSLRSELPPPFARARLTVDMAPQPVMDVFDAIPAAFRHLLEGTEMRGTVGWELDVSANYERLSSGRLEVDIPAPSAADVFDETVELVALPEAVDVRRLIEGFSFTFVDGIEERRQLTIGIDNPRWVTLDLVSPMMIESILNTEDQSFFESDGFNWYQMRRVIGDLLAEQEMGRGASTITMQLVKNVFLSRERLVSRKLTEMFLTYWMTKLVPKETIFAVYLNVIEFGPGVNGIAEAAEYYFGKLPIDLTLQECTFLVSIVPNPRMYHVFYEQGAITERWWIHMQRYIDRLLEREVITPEQHEAALVGPPEFYVRVEGDPALRPVEPDVPYIPIFDDLFDHESSE